MMRKMFFETGHFWGPLALVISQVLSYIHSFIHSFIHSYIHSFIHSFIHSLNNSFIQQFIHSFKHSFIPSNIHSFIVMQCCFGRVSSIVNSAFGFIYPVQNSSGQEWFLRKLRSPPRSTGLYIYKDSTSCRTVGIYQSVLGTLL